MRLMMLAALCLCAVNAHALTIVNGDFEDTSFSGSFVTVRDTSHYVPGWRVTNGGGADLLETFSPAYHGDYSLELDSRTIVENVITGTVVGRSYTIYFAYSSRPGSGSNGSLMRVAAANEFIDLSWTLAEADVFVGTWLQGSLSFTATDTSTSVLFENLEGTVPRSGGDGPIIDCLRLTQDCLADAVPSPPTAPLLLLCLPFIMSISAPHRAR